jgi:hypothetical protein
VKLLKKYLIECVKLSVAACNHPGCHVISINAPLAPHYILCVGVTTVTAAANASGSTTTACYSAVKLRAV